DFRVCDHRVLRRGWWWWWWLVVSVLFVVMVLIVKLEVLIVELFVDLFVGLFVVVFVEEKSRHWYPRIVRVLEKDRWCGTRGKFVRWKGVRVTKSVATWVVVVVVVGGVSVVCGDGFDSEVGETHLNTMKRVLRYLRGTTDLGLQLFQSTTSQLIAYSDADWDTLSRSSAEAEYREVANAIAETSWIRNLLRELYTLLFTATLVVSRHQATQQYGAILPIELTTNEIQNSKAYQEYYACAMGEAAPKPKASARKKKGDSASSTTLPTPTPTTTAESAPPLSVSAKEQLKIVLKRSRRETHISQQSGYGIGEGTGSKPGVSDVPSDDSEEELSWKSSNDEEVGSKEEGNESNDDSDDGSDKDSEETVKSGAGKDGDEDDDEDDDDDDEEEETTKAHEETKETGTGGNEVRESGGKSEEEKETSKEEEVSFDPIPRTPEDSEKESDDEEEHESRLRKEARIQEEEDTEELYRDVNINKGRGLQVTQSIEDTHVILTPVNPDDPQESSSMSSFVKIEEAVREAVQKQTYQLQDSLQRENDKFLRNIDENMKNVLKGLVKTQVKEQVSRILPRVEESVNATLEAEVFTRSSHSSRTSYAVAADLLEMELKKTLIEKMEGNKSIQRSDEQQNLYKALVEAYEADKAILDTYGESTILKRRKEDDDQEGPSAGPNRGSKRQKKGGE
nr:hypothetical protein [Tanacetum cinerariifolium]